MRENQANPNTTHLLIRHNEIALKGKNRTQFERRLILNLNRCMGNLGQIHNASGRIVIELKTQELKRESSGLDRLVEKLATVSGVSAITPCLLTVPQAETIHAQAIDWAKQDLQASPDAKTFAVRTRRVDKKFPFSSAQTDASIGSEIKRLREGLSVDLKKPDLKVKIEVRSKHALIYSWEKAGVCGLPVDVSQRVVCLLSGGIDSPVAAFEVIRRGCSPVFVHFHSKPFTSEASISKVKRLAAILRKHCPHPVELWLVPLLDVQKAVRDSCNERLRTIHYRRFMMAIAQEIAFRRGAMALVTGEALGQVASQTLTNLLAIEDQLQMPVLRPLITTDKAQIIEKAKALETFEISVEPHDDTCVLFAPLKPATQARLSFVREDEDSLSRYALIFAAADAAEKVIV